MPKETQQPNPIEAEFQRLADAYKVDVANDLNPNTWSSEARNKILEKGAEFLEFIMSDLKHEPSLWLPLLPRLTGENPVQQRHLGNMNEMRNDWSSWYERRAAEGQSQPVTKLSPQTA